jgi:hypothetical protein
VTNYGGQVPSGDPRPTPTYFAACRLIAQYNATPPMPGPSMFSVLRERLLLRQFIVSDFAVKQAEFLRNVGEWMPSSTDWKRRPGRSWREGKNFGETCQLQGAMPGPLSHCE